MEQRRQLSSLIVTLRDARRRQQSTRGIPDRKRPRRSETTVRVSPATSIRPTQQIAI